MENLPRELLDRILSFVSSHAISRRSGRLLGMCDSSVTDVLALRFVCRGFKESKTVRYSFGVAKAQEVKLVQTVESRVVNYYYKLAMKEREETEGYLPKLWEPCSKSKEVIGKYIEGEGDAEYESEVDSMEESSEGEDDANYEVEDGDEGENQDADGGEDGQAGSN
ncbi:hypothetical protein BCR34DRAFT_596109 [Clohesyomyces aquaticus]|uniref:F-box domain-containing protein n=1 Tax=Clohesyomyces aquaticus TaxID=1231657 RepID=A0A1Y2A876_9PLEO|nr:hypothetical protein BCR34DRAFT_596109 [Clohesyomyces aquaticus]